MRNGRQGTSRSKVSITEPYGSSSSSPSSSPFHSHTVKFTFCGVQSYGLYHMHRVL